MTSSESPVLLDVDLVEVRYASQRVVNGMSFRLRRGGFACLLGPSGCGKSTTLRAIAGFEPLTAGSISILGTCVSRPGFTRPPEQRGIGLVFQEDALFPHLNVFGNVGYGLHGLSRRDKRRTVDELLDVVGLSGLGSRFVHELSGGQRQRVALARALAPQPRLLLLDEPFSSLDVDLRERLGYEVRDILRERGTTAVLVTHDQSEAFALAEQIGVMHDGELLQWDHAYNLYHEPAHRFVADFIGQGVFIRGRLVTPETIDTELGTLRGNRAYGWPRNCEVDVLLRPDDIVPDSSSSLRAVVDERAFKGAQILYTLRLPTGSQVLALFPSHLEHMRGEAVGIKVQADHLVAFRAS